jgi:ribosomal protein S12 methylthiotransferase
MPAVAEPLTVGLVSLGCAKNLVDAEIMLGGLLRDGFRVVNDPTQADAVIVNTCSFIDAAQEESVDAILESGQVRDAHRQHQALVVAGCLAQRFRDQLPELFPEVDAFMGIDQVAQVGAIVREALSRRQQRLKAPPPPSRPQRPSKARPSRSPGPGQRRQAIVGRLDALAPLAPREGSESTGPLSGTGKPGQTRTVVGATGSGSIGTPGVPGWLGVAPFVDIRLRPQYIPDYTTPRFRLTPRHFAYLKIAEGCNHPCSFCTIPRMRGRHRSRPQADVIEEARRLLDEGVREINLISQDSTYYGLDVKADAGGSPAGGRRATLRVGGVSDADSGPTLGTLLRDLDALPGDFWIRLLYTHPAHWTDTLIRTFADCPKVARYVDIPLQHIHDDLLDRMRRETSEQFIVDLLDRIRAAIPGIALRTTFIVGFPGETDAHFARLLEFVRQTRFERLGVFTYSQEDGTPAGRLPDQIPARVKRERRDTLMAAQVGIARDIAQTMVGRTIKVLVEGPNPRPGKAGPATAPPAADISREHGSSAGARPRRTRPYPADSVARGEADAPDIDGRVYLRGQRPSGEFVHVRVVGHGDYDLFAE